MRALLPLLVVALLLGCSQRDRLNPFDPSNPSTGGRPAEFKTFAGDARVTITWLPASAPDLLGFQLFRRVQGESGFTAISSVLSPALGAYTDLSVQNGRDHTYRLHFVFDRGLGTLFSEDVATPGPLRPYVTEFEGGARARLTPDGRRIWSRSGGFFHPTGLAIDRRTGTVWTSDPFAGLVEILSPGTGQVEVISGLRRPDAMAVDEADETAWICDAGDDAVLHYTRFGTLATPSRLSLLDDPIDVAVDRINRTVWVCERGGNRVRAYANTGTPQWSVDLAQPSRVAVDSVTKAGWVTSFMRGAVWSISATGAIQDSMTALAGPIGVSVDARRGIVWVADALAGQLVALDRNASVMFRVGGLPEVREIAVDLATGNAWVTLPGDGQVAIVNPVGVVVRRVGGLSEPLDIVIDPGP